MARVGLVRAAAAALVVTSLLACTGIRLPFVGGGWDNVGACREYVSSYNALECVADHDRLDPDDNCPPALDAFPCDLQEHYRCMIPRTLCKDGRVDVSGHLECGDRSCN